MTKLAYVTRPLMSREVRIAMPTDLRNESRTIPLQLQLEEDVTFRNSSSWRKRGITSLTLETPTRTTFTPDGVKPPGKARWRTLEFIIYALVFAVAIPVMIRVPMRLSDSTLSFHFAMALLLPAHRCARLAPQLPDFCEKIVARLDPGSIYRACKATSHVNHF